MNNAPTERPGRRVPLNREALKRRRIEAGLTQKALAAKVGIAHQSLSGIECGDHGMSPTSLVKFAEALGCSPADLLSPEVA